MPDKISCKYCGWNGFKMGLALSGKYVICPSCGRFIEPNTYTMEQIVRDESVEKMKWHIKELGEEWVWNFIEQWQDAKIRLAYRKLYFEAGGKVPERKYKSEK